MKLSEISWTRGFTRIYLLVVVLWFLYWVLWIPLDQVHDWQQLALLTEDKAKQEEYWAHANLSAQWRELADEMVRSPFATLLVVFVPPVFGYIVLRGVLTLVGWVFHGFSASMTSSNPLGPTATREHPKD